MIVKLPLADKGRFVETRAVKSVDFEVSDGKPIVRVFLHGGGCNLYTREQAMPLLVQLDIFDEMRLRDVQSYQEGA